MPVGHTTWKVLPHGPVEELAPNLWRVAGKLSDSNTRLMTVARLGDGRLVVHNAIALDDAGMAKLDAWGEVAAILVPNGFHRMDACIWQERYPKAKVYAPTGAIKAAAKATPVAGSYADAPQDGTVTLRDLDGIGQREGVMLVRGPDGVSAVFCDTVLNLPAMGGPMGWILAPTGTLSVPRPTRWLFTKDKDSLKRDLVRIAEEDGFVRVVPGHGADVVGDAAARLREAADRV